MASVSVAIEHRQPYEADEADSGLRIRWIFLFALLLRLAIALLVAHAKPSTWFYAQASELGAVAQSLAHGEGFASPFPHTGPSAFLPPGYPLLVALLFKLSGAYSQGAATALMMLQASFGAAAIAFTTLVAERLFGRSTAAVTGWACALHPWLIALSFVFWDTSCSIMLMSALLYLALRVLEEPTHAHTLALALLAATAIAINPALALTAITLLLWCAMHQRNRIRIFLLPALLFLALCSIWPIRNLRTMHAFIPLRDNLGYELWQGNRPGGDGFFAAELHPNQNLTELHRYQRLGELGYVQEKSQLAKQAITAQPSRFIGLSMRRFSCFWLGISKLFAMNQFLVAVFTTTFGLLGIHRLIRKRGLTLAMPAIIPMLLFPLPYYVTHPDFRFWCILAPLLTSAAFYSLTTRAAHSDIHSAA